MSTVAFRTFDNEPVFPRPAVGDTSQALECSCGVTFCGRVDAVQGYGEPVELAYVTHRGDGGCGSTRVYYVELEPISPAQRLTVRRLFERIEPVYLARGPHDEPSDPDVERAERLADEADDERDAIAEERAGVDLELAELGL